MVNTTMGTGEQRHLDYGATSDGPTSVAIPSNWVSTRRGFMYRESEFDVT